ncbi:MAG: hypothetical protein WAM43_10905 [Terriglobales bacterium]
MRSGWKLVAPTRMRKRRSSNGPGNNYRRRLEAKFPTIWMGRTADVPSRDGTAWPKQLSARRPWDAGST